jgi:hypothetical protein
VNATKGRETLYKGIRMRSRLEADFAADLDRQGYRWGYEPTCFAGPDGQWLPDFGCTFANDDDWAIFDEVKPAEPLMKHAPGSVAYAEHVDTQLRRVAVAWESAPDACLRLTFWRYGGPAYLTLFCRRRGHPWRASFDGQPMEMIWPGMRQHVKAALVEPSFRDEIARRWLGLTGATAQHAWPGGLADGVLAVYADSEEWVAKIRRQEDRLIQMLGVVFFDGLVRKIDVQLCEVAS